jgi:hypothetical protein
MAKDEFDIFNLEETCITTGLKGKIILIYGDNNTGKSKQASLLFPHRTLFLATERGYNALGAIKKLDITNWITFRKAVSKLTSKKTIKQAQSLYDAVVIDVADRLPLLCESYICDTNEVDNISEVPWGQGYTQLKVEFDRQINTLALSGYLVVLICHATTKEDYVNPVTGETYPYTFPKNTNTKSGCVLKDIPDFSIYLQNNGTDENEDVVLSTGICSHRKNVFARSRFTQCPTRIEPFTAENLKETIRIACEKEAEALGVECITFEEQIAKNEEALEKLKPTFEELVGDVRAYGKALKEYSDETAYIMEKHLGEHVKLKELKEDSYDRLEVVLEELVDLADKKNIEVDA